MIAIDSRGRGQSDYDSNPENYNLAVELGDVVTVLTALEIGKAVFVGSSRGGILTMLLGVAHPTAIAGVVLHDIGPVIEPKGLARIKSYVGKLPQPRNFAEGSEILRRLFDAQFPKLTAEQWLAAAQRTWKLDDGELVPTYDVRLARTLAEFDIERPLPAMWNEFDALVARAGSGHPRRQFRHSFGRDGRPPCTRVTPAWSSSKSRTRAMFRSSIARISIDRIVEFVGRCDAVASRSQSPTRQSAHDQLRLPQRKIPGGGPPGISDFTPRSDDQGRKSLCMRTLSAPAYSRVPSIERPAPPKESGEAIPVQPWHVFQSELQRGAVHVVVETSTPR